jgi:hypothetical protein
MNVLRFVYTLAGLALMIGGLAAMRDILPIHTAAPRHVTVDYAAAGVQPPPRWYTFSLVPGSSSPSAAAFVLPGRNRVSASSMETAIETFASQHHLTVDSMNQNDVWYIAENGAQINVLVQPSKAALK